MPVIAPLAVILVTPPVRIATILEDHFTNLVCEPVRSYATHRNHVFTDAYSFGEHPITQCDALRSLTVENAGGKSEVSEALSMQYFHERFGASQFLLEREVEYWCVYKMVDFVCTIAKTRIGVSVTRAMGFPTPDHFDAESALHLLRKKLYGLIVARNAVDKKHRFFKSILHIFCQTPHIAALLREAYAGLDVNDFGLNIKGAVILRLTVCVDPRVYQNRL